jgi:hypothetical protein
LRILGSRYVDDLRNTRLPLPMSPPVGGVTGPPGWAGMGGGMDWWVPPELRHPWHVLPAYPPRDPLPEMGPHPLLPNPDSARTEACGTTEAKQGGKGGSGGSSDKWDSYYSSMEAAAGGSFARPDPSGSAGAGSAQSAPSGGRSKEPNDAMAEAMKAQDPWGWFSWLGNLYGGYAVDASDPDDPSAMGHAVADAALPFFGLGRQFYDWGNRVRGGRWDSYFNAVSPATYNRWGTGAIVAGLGIITGIAFGSVLGAEALADTTVGSRAIGTATRWGRWGYYRVAGQMYRWAVRAPIGAGIKKVGDYGEQLVARITGLTPNDEFIYSKVDWLWRKPDLLNRAGTVLVEVKNRASLGYTTQLEGLVRLAQERGSQVELYTRVGTRISPELREVIRSGLITWYNIIPW